MAIISSYPKDVNISLMDKLIGTDADSSLATKNIEIGDFITFIGNNLPTKEDVDNKSTNTGLGGNTPSDTLYPTQKAVKTYVDGIESNLRDSLFDLNQDVAGLYSIKENIANKSTNVSLGTSDTLYPTQKAVKTYVDGIESNLRDSLFDLNQDVAGLYSIKENIANKSTNVTTDGASDTKYPSVKAVKTYVDANSGGGSQVVKSVKVTLTPLQVQSLFTTPIKVIDCPIGKAVLPMQILNITNNEVSGYSPSGGNLALRYEGLISNIISCNHNLGSFGIGEGYAPSATSITSGGYSRDGEDVYVRLLTADPVGGDGGMILYITYSEITL